MYSYKVFLVCLLAACQVSSAYKILMAAYIGGMPNSHRSFMEKMANRLARDNQDVHFLVGEEFPINGYFKVIRYPSMPADLGDNLEDFKKSLQTGITMERVFHGTNIVFSAICEKLVSNERLLQQLKAEEFDVVFIDMNDSCGFLLVQFLGRKFITIVSTSYFQLFWSEAPTVMSYMPTLYGLYSDEMSFLQRLNNVVWHAREAAVTYLLVHPTYNNLGRKYGLIQDTSVYEISRKASLIFMNSDFVLDFPRPHLPNTVFVGGVMASRAHRLSGDIQEFVENPQSKGTILVSFGSLIDYLDEEIAGKLRQCVTTLSSYQFIIRLKQTKEQLKFPDNTFVSDWVPQNDVLGHNKTVAFLTHGGNNGVWEAVYHGVPVIVFPMFMDQFYNAAKVVKRGMGLSMDINHFHANSLEENIRRIVANESFRYNAKQTSRYYHMQPMNNREDRIFYWTMYVLRTDGATHLIPGSTKLNLVQYLLLDVAFVVLLVLVIFYYCILRPCVRKIFRTSNQQKLFKYE